MTACGAIGALIVGGRVVGELRCEKPAGHLVGEPSDHGVMLEWGDLGEPPDLDLFDPDESFDVNVSI